MGDWCSEDTTDTQIQGNRGKGFVALIQEVG